MTRQNPISDGPHSPGDCTNFTESQLEAAIDAAHERLINAPTWEEKLARWREMVRLIDQRTPARVRFMERKAGLA